MGISEFLVHNVLRTYSRQERLGRVQKPRGDQGQVSRASDQVTVSSAARKSQWVGQFAAELVTAHHPGLAREEAAAQTRATADDLLSRHRADMVDETLTPEAFEAALRQRYQR